MSRYVQKVSIYVTYMSPRICRVVPKAFIFLMFSAHGPGPRDIYSGFSDIKF